MKHFSNDRAARRGKLLLAASLATCFVFLSAAQLGAQATHVDEISYPPLPAFDIPEPERFELPNGMVVMLLKDDELPLVEAQIRIRTGSRWEPMDKVGLAGLMGTVQRSGGTQKMASDALDDWLEDRAARVETFVTTSFGGASMSCLKGDVDDVMRVFYDVLRYPAFEAGKFDVAKNQVISGISRRNDSPFGVLGREFTKIIYGDESPYATNSSYETIGSITRDDLVEWHAAHYHPDRMILGVIGDFDPKKMRRLVTEVFGAWSRGPKVEEPEVAYQKEAAPGIYFAEKNDVTQAFIRIGHMGIVRDNPDYYPLEVLNQVLSGSFASRLFTNVRSKKGLAYSVGGQVGSRWDYPGTFFMNMSTKTETTVAGIEALLEEAESLTSHPPTEGEVQRAKAAILNSFIFNSDSRDEILSQQLTFEYFGYPSDWLERYQTGVEGVTVEQVRRVAEQYIHPDRFSILVVGKTDGIDRPLDELGKVQMVDISIPEPAAAERVAVTSEGSAQAKELLGKAVMATGGAERIDGLKALRTEAKTAIHNTPQGEMSVQATQLIAFAEGLRQEVKMPFGTIVQVVKGDTGFVQTPQGKQDLQASQVASLKKEMRRDLLTFLRMRHDDNFEATVAGEGTVDGTPVALVQVEVEGETSVLGIDPDSGRVLSMDYPGQDMTGVPGQVRRVYSDYREVEDGVVLPYLVEITIDGKPMATSTAESIELDPPITDATFEASTTN